jgi:hypothetical protein
VFSRRVFIRGKAPLTGFANSVAICSLVDRALERAGVESEYRGSHVFRHNTETSITLSHGALKRIPPHPREKGGDVIRIIRQHPTDWCRSYTMCDDTVFQTPTSNRAFSKWPTGGSHRPVR